MADQEARLEIREERPPPVARRPDPPAERGPPAGPRTLVPRDRPGIAREAPAFAEETEREIDVFVVREEPVVEDAAVERQVGKSLAPEERGRRRDAGDLERLRRHAGDV